MFPTGHLPHGSIGLKRGGNERGCEEEEEEERGKECGERKRWEKVGKRRMSRGKGGGKEMGGKITSMHTAIPVLWQASKGTCSQYGQVAKVE